MDPRRTSITLPHSTVSTLEWRPECESAVPVLLLHGGGADSAELSWGAVGAALAAAGHHVFAPDHPGFGRSARAEWPLTQERLVRHVGELVDGLGLHDYAIAGLSLGGGMTLGHLLDQPGRARSAVLLGCYGLMPRLADGLVGRITHFGTFMLLRTGLLAAMTRSYARNRSAMERGLGDLVRTPQARTPELVEAVLTEAAVGTGLETFAQWQHNQVLWNRLRTLYTPHLPSITTSSSPRCSTTWRGPPMPRPRVPDRRDRILDAAEELVLAHGFDAMSVASIADRAGIGKGAVYLEFAGKREILDALLQRGTTRMNDRVSRELGDRPRLSAAYRASARALSDDALMTAAFLDDRGILGEHVAEVTDGRYRDRQRRVIEWLRALQDRGEIVADVDVEALALALSSASIGLLSAARLLGPFEPGHLERAIDTIGRMAETFERD